MNGNDPPRVALVTNILAHYRVPCFRLLADRLEGRLTIYLLTGDMAHRRYVKAHDDGNLPVVHLRGWRWRRPPQDDRHLNDVRPILSSDWRVLILGGWNEPTHLLLWLWALARRRKIIFWVESTALDLPRTAAKEAVKRLLLKQAAACLVPGQRAGEYCHQLGVDRRRIFTAPNATDRRYFRQRADRLLPQRPELRRAAGVRRPTVLFVGRLVERYKGVESLLRAAALLEQRGTVPSLLVAGEGPDEASYRLLAGALGLTDARFLGNLDHEELCRYYAMADVLVLPSRSEPWGFVLNEGMEFGLPLVVSDRVGAGPDLVVPGDNGFTVALGDAAGLAAAVEQLSREESLRRRMGAASRRRIEGFSPRNWTDGSLEAIEAACGV